MLSLTFAINQDKHVLNIQSNIPMFVIKWKVPSVFSLKIKSVQRTFKSNIVCKKKHSLNVFTDAHNNQEKTVTLYNNCTL